MKYRILLGTLLLCSGVMALEVIEAKLGAGDRWADATEAFRKTRVNDDLYCIYFSGRSLIGKDPAPGKIKSLIVKYKDNDGSMQTRTLSEKCFTGIAAQTPGPSGKFTFGRAFWGDNGQWVEVTTKMREVLASGQEIKLKTGSVGAEKDPLPGKIKYLMMFYSVGGRQYAEAFREDSRFKSSMIDGSFAPIPLAAEVVSPFRGMELDRAVWQWSIDMRGTCNPENHLPSKAFLYIPEKTKKLRGVVVGQYNMLERPMMEHPKFRETLQKLDYGCIWIAPSPFKGKPFNGQFDFRNEEQVKALETMFLDLAELSGYGELAELPFVGLGHSAMADFPYQLAAWKPERAIAGISFDGAAPGVSYRYEYGKDPILNDEAVKRIEGIPFLFRSSGIGGNTNFRAQVVRQRRPQIAVTVVMDPGSSHFDINDQIIEYIGKYLVKADTARGVGSGPLKPLNAKEGWYVDYWRYNDPPKTPAAPVSDFKPASSGKFGPEANWVIDGEHAVFHEAHEALYRGKKIQLLAYVQEGRVLPDRKTHFQIHPRFIPERDGLSFKIKGTFLDVVTEGRAPGAIHQKAGTPIVHGSDVQNIRIDSDCGPVVRIDDETMAVRFDRFGFTNSGRSNSFSMIAVHPGDDVYRRSVLQSAMSVPLFNEQGTRQVIDFPAIADVRLGTESLTLKARCNTGMPVEYLVVHGPAYLKDQTLIFTEIPPHAKFPVEVELIAWQYGSKNEPKLQSAQPVTRKFNIIK